MKNFILMAMALLVTVAVYPQKKKSNYPLYTIADIGKAKEDTVRLKVYVLDVYVCPPCPAGMICKPCIENNLTAVDEKPVDIFKIPLEKRLRVFTQHPDSLKVGKRYLLTVRFRNKGVSPNDNVELISWKPQK